MCTSSDARLHFEGVLEKAGKRFFEGFRKRWFTLDGQYLTYYKAPQKTEENYLGTIDFSQVKAVNPSKMASNGFQIITKSRTYTFSAPTPDLQTEWISVLRQAMQLKSFEQRNSRLSSQESLDSQYEEIANRRSRSLSSDQRFDENDAADELYSCIEGNPANQSSVGEYNVVGAATVPRTVKGSNMSETYELVGSRPPSKSAPPTYEMVQAAKEGVLENGGGLYSLVGEEPVGKKVRNDARPTQQIVTAAQSDVAENPVVDSDISALYSTVPKLTRRQNESLRGLSMISESEKEETEEEPPLPESPEEEAPPLTSRKLDPGEAFAIREIKSFLETTAKEDGENEICDEGKDANDEQDVLVRARTGSAFQQLKAFLQELDSTEEEN